MKKAVITILGAAGKQENRCIYRFSDKKFENYNMLGFLIDNFKGYEIIPVYTDYARQVQENVLKKEEKEEYIDKLFSHKLSRRIDDNEDYDTVLGYIDDIISSFNEKDEVILDITHGFRHLPILMIIDALIQYISTPEKIKNILFAKEIIREKEYEVVDIKEYLELAVFMMMLTNFKNNFTLNNGFKFSNKDFERVSKNLNEFSKNILSNGVGKLIKGELIDDILKDLNAVKKLKKIKVFENKLKDIEEYLNSFKENYKNPLYEAHLFLAKEFFNKGYYLNSMTTLIEAVALYSVEVVKREIPEIKKEIEKELNRKSYDILQDCKNIFIINLYKFKAKSEVFKNNLELIKAKFKKDPRLSDLIRDLNKLRNDLAHINMQKISFNINDLKKYLNEFDNLIKVK